MSLPSTHVPELSQTFGLRWGVCGWGLQRNSTVPRLLGGKIIRVYLTPPKDLDFLLGWGRKRVARRARSLSEKYKIPYVSLEDGFIRSMSFGRSEEGLSLVVDDLGIYYDASGFSRLEVLAQTNRSSEELERARGIRDLWCQNSVSKYNNARDFTGLLPDDYVLAVDQTFGDASISCGMADRESFQKMLAAALAENPESTVVLKVHPEVLAGRKKGHFDLDKLRENSRLRIIGEDVHPSSLLKAARKIYTVTSQMGFEGLLYGKEVRTFGMPFYAGWGLTRDDLPAPERRKKISLEQLIYAALVVYSRYLDPETHLPCEPERLIEWIGLQRRMRERFAPKVYASGFSIWKKPILESFMQGSRVLHLKTFQEAPAQGTFVSWSSKIPAGQEEQKWVRVEDGFIRSVGLGAELVRPLSWVFDQIGIYYDATRESGLERILRTTEFSARLASRAKALRERIVNEGFTKYNVGSTSWARPQGVNNVLLVTGQVETDASIKVGAADIRTNQELLKCVRVENPDAYILYKPHPDVRAGLRAGGFDEADPLSYCNEILGNCSLADLFPAIDEVHVLTSLSGFEGLLRGKKVVTYGQPFFAGWGLTQDKKILPSVLERRQRHLTLDELVAGTLILYPTYVSRLNGRFTTPERALDEIAEWRKQADLPQHFWEKAKRRMMRTFSR